MSDLFIWSCCKPFIGIVCACLPTLAPFFRRWWTSMRTTGASSFDTPTPGGSKNVHSNSKSVDVTITSASSGGIGNTVREGLRGSKNKREWARLHGGHGSPKLRSDDEVELTNEISGPGQGRTIPNHNGDGTESYAMSDIYVKKDVSWNSSRLDSPPSSTDGA